MTPKSNLFLLITIVMSISSMVSCIASTPVSSPNLTPTNTATTTQEPFHTSTPTSTPTLPPSPTLSAVYPVLAGTPLPPPLEAISPANADRVIELARWEIPGLEGEGIFQIAFSPNGNALLFLPTSAKKFHGYWKQDFIEGKWVRAWIPPSNLQVSRIRLPENIQELIVNTEAKGDPFLSPDGALLMTVSGTLKIFRLPEFTLLTEVQAPSGIWSSGFSENGGVLWLSGAGKAAPYDTTNGRKISTIKWAEQLDQETIVANWLRSAPDAYSLQGAQVSAWPAADLAKDCSLRIITSSVQHDIAISRLECSIWLELKTDWRTGYYRISPWSLDAWNVKDGSHLRQLTGIPGTSDMVIANTPEGLTLVVNLGTTIKLFDFVNGSLRREIGNPNQYYQDIVFWDKGRLLAAISLAGIELWNVSTGELLTRIPIVGSGAYALSPDKYYIATLTDGSMLRLWGIPR